MFERVLARVGYVPASVEAERDQLRVDLKIMTAARDEMALRNASAVEAFVDLETRYNDVVAEHEAALHQFDVERLQQQNALDTLAEQLESANELIRVLQSERPQMRLVRNEKPIGRRGDESESDAAPAEDEILVAEHTVEMYARVIVISFEGKTHWTLSVGDHLFKVPVHDRAFLEDPEHRFAKGSLVRAEFLETTLRRAGDGEPYTRRSLERVIEVIQPSPQTTQPLFADATAASERS